MRESFASSSGPIAPQPGNGTSCGHTAAAFPTGTQPRRRSRLFAPVRLPAGVIGRQARETGRRHSGCQDGLGRPRVPPNQSFIWSQTCGTIIQFSAPLDFLAEHTLLHCAKLDSHSLRSRIDLALFPFWGLSILVVELAIFPLHCG